MTGGGCTPILRRLRSEVKSSILISTQKRRWNDDSFGCAHGTAGPYTYLLSRCYDRTEIFHQKILLIYAVFGTFFIGLSLAVFALFGSGLTYTVAISFSGNSHGFFCFYPDLGGSFLQKAVPVYQLLQSVLHFFLHLNPSMQRVITCTVRH